ncbi:MAG: aspartate/tyrosine/aromatic aminotransferase [Verrucomicrobiae bacterium]|nr:aspartate/tyrosine/aromatic aminotransferase [Verrucomicrobiae bacterium]NNJ42463.1 aspartate/tyrosine/aromatic aminotransferase [Akkermansiaceae bacterium]
MSLFDSATQAPADPILGLSSQFKKDTRENKVNLGVGVFVDAHGVTPVLPSVLNVEKQLADASASKSYLPMTGSPAYASATQNLCFGQSLASQLDGRIVTAQTPGGTGALRVAGDFLKRTTGTLPVWLSNPTWANHKGIFTTAGHTLKEYAYFDSATNAVDRDAFFADLQTIPAGDVAVIHACCHNPTGADLSADDWKQVAAIASDKGWLPLLDFAYQGFGENIDADAVGVRTLAEAGLPVIVCQSFSKNFGLYQDRIGALHIVCASTEEATRVKSQVELCIRTNYSNPPAHGGAIVTAILNDPTLTSQWDQEVAGMRDRIKTTRADFVSALQQAGVSRDFSFLMDQKGMFSFTGITVEQVTRLREEFAIYMVNSGRINVAGITPSNLTQVAGAIKTVIG